ncbi:hypothetical protein [Sphingosinicella sp.]|uniref:hypothetical protein n=1 Tax=Sphingosinicella sp. TaxID=1917971 RepID=UPI0026154C55|nr:hypothetical protein [Sphingosinicella sp.]
MKPVLFVLTAAALLAGCAASYESRIERSLTSAGISRPVAGCMADQMVDRLSTTQLKRLARFAKGVDRREVERMSLREIQKRFQAIGDPEIVEVVTRAGLGCALMGA